MVAFVHESFSFTTRNHEWNGTDPILISADVVIAADATNFLLCMENIKIIEEAIDCTKKYFIDESFSLKVALFVAIIVQKARVLISSRDQMMAHEVLAIAITADKMIIFIITKFNMDGYTYELAGPAACLLTRMYNQDNEGC